MTARPLYPDIVVQLSDRDGNAVSILTRVRTALRRGGVPADKLAAFTAEVTAGDYDNVLATAFRWVTVL